MRPATIYTCILSALICASGCTQTRTTLTGNESKRPARPESVIALESTHTAESPEPYTLRLGRATEDVTESQPVRKTTRTAVWSKAAPAASSRAKLRITPVGHEVLAVSPENTGTITIDGRRYQIQLVDEDAAVEIAAAKPLVQQLAKINAGQTAGSTDNPFRQASSRDEHFPEGEVVSEIIPSDTTLLNLPTALSMIGGDHPAIGFAQWKVQEAYAVLDQAEVLWLPSIQTGFSFHRHDGNYQASNGDIVDVNRSSLQYGLGAGATGAGTTPVPGLRAQFHLADAIFAPDIAKKTAWAAGHAEKAVVNRQLRDVALAYMKLLDAHQQQRILEDIRGRTAGLAKITDDFAGAGQGLQADADRMQTELMLIDGRIAVSRENVDVASARLAHALSTDAGQRIIPMDSTVVPIDLISADMDRGSLISSGLSARPELKQLQALVAAACDRYQRQKYSPFVPSVLLGFSAGGFGGDTGNAINSVDDRYDFDAMVTWEVRNFGFGERAARRQTEAQVQQAMYQKVKLIDDVAREISEAHTQVLHRRERMAVTQQSIRSARDSYDRNLSRIREGAGLPIEVMLSVQALEASQRAYLDSVIAYNEAQFQLQWALGWHVCAPDGV